MTTLRPVINLRIVHLGALPPPHGGITVHCERLLSALQRDGVDAFLLDHRRLRPQSMLRDSHWRDSARAFYGLITADVVFIHFSAMRSTGAVLRILALACLLRRKRIILVPHSGTFAWELAANGYRGALLRRVVKASDGLIAMSGAIQAAVSRFVPNCATVRGSSFIPDALILDIRDQARVLSRPAETPVLITSGYRTSVYGYQEIIAAVDRLRLTWEDMELHIYAYGNSIEQNYWAEVYQAVERRPYVKVFVDEDPKTFLTAVSMCKVLVRNTKHDSYGVAVAEALFLGVPVVASDVCERPQSATTFPAGDPELLYAAIVEVLSTPIQALDMDWGSDGYAAYSEVFRLVSKADR